MTDKSEVLSAVMRMSDGVLDVRTKYDAMTMSTIIQADMQSAVARQLEQRVVEGIALRCGMSTTLFLSFMEFLAQDPELQGRFTAWRVTQRLLK
jgi:hypothetical protein